MPKRLSLTDLENAKAKIGFNWTWKSGIMPEKKIEGKCCRAYFKLKCGTCNQYEGWVEWGALSKGRTKCCVNCTTKRKLPTLEEMRALIQKHNMLWQPSLIHKIDPKTKRRRFWMKCHCGKPQWVHWGLFQSGQHTGCRSCAARNVRKSLGKLDYSKNYLKKTWYAMQRQKRVGQATIYWPEFRRFKDWALDSGYRDGATLELIDSGIRCSSELEAVLNVGSVKNRSVILKKLWAYIRNKGLQDPEDKRWIYPNEVLSPIFGNERFHIRKIMAKLSKDIVFIQHKYEPTNLLWNTSKCKETGRTSISRVRGYNTVEL